MVESTCRDGGPTKQNGNCTNPGPDGLPVQCVGEWAEHDKHEYLRRYIDATRGSRRKFVVPDSHGRPPGGAGYVDLYSGPGKVRLREDGGIFDGSPLIALGYSKVPFTTVVLCDIDDENISTLRARTAPYAGRTRIIPGDCNAMADKIVAALPKHGLNIAFVDPFSLEPLHFATLAKLASLTRLDVVVNFPTQPVKRNLHHYLKPDNQTLDRALGTDAWRKNVRSPSDVHLVLDVLISQLENLGYTGTRNRTISVKNSTNTELYRLIFASKHPLGDKIWGSITSTTARGQRGLPGF